MAAVAVGVNGAAVVDVGIAFSEDRNHPVSVWRVD